MAETTVRIGKWNVPQKLYDEYVKFRIFAAGYLIHKKEVPSQGGETEEYERSLRWNLCVQKMIEIHMKICDLLGIPYSQERDDEFYRAFSEKTGEDAELKGG